MGAEHRTRQFLRALVPGRNCDLPPAARELLSEREQALFNRMARYDKAHSLRVFHELRKLAPGNKPLQVAGLLHDAGKGLPSLGHRVGLVLARQYWPRDLGRWAKMPMRSYRAALWGLANHAEIGARFLEAAGSDPRVVEMVRSQGDFTLPDAAILARVDAEC